MTLTVKVKLLNLCKIAMTMLLMDIFDLYLQKNTPENTDCFNCLGMTLNLMLP